MTKSYYGFSLIISVVIYATLGLFVLAFLEIPKKFTKKPREKAIKIALITPAPKVITPPIIIPKPPKEIIKPKKIIKKVIKKPKPKPKPKKIIKKPKPKPKKIIKKKKAILKPIIKEEYFTPAPKKVYKYVEPQIIQAPRPPQPAEQPKADKSAEKRAFLRTVRSQIKNNKKYPKMALRRHIEGSVGVIFDIGTNGSVSNIRFQNGKSILQKSVRKAVTRSFPINIPSNISNEFPMYNISVTIHFKIN